MKTRIHTARTAMLAATVTAALLGLPQISFSAPVGSGTIPQAAQSSQAANEAASRLNKKQFSQVKVDVDGNGVATLSGNVALYAFKADADKRLQKAKGITAVRNNIQVAGPVVPDSVLKAKLAEKLAYDRVGTATSSTPLALTCKKA